MKCSVCGKALERLRVGKWGPAKHDERTCKLCSEKFVHHTRVRLDLKTPNGQDIVRSEVDEVRVLLAHFCEKHPVVIKEMERETGIKVEVTK